MRKGHWLALALAVSVAAVPAWGAPPKRPSTQDPGLFESIGQATDSLVNTVFGVFRPGASAATPTNAPTTPATAGNDGFNFDAFRAASGTGTMDPKYLDAFRASPDTSRMDKKYLDAFRASPDASKMDPKYLDSFRYKGAPQPQVHEK